MNMAQTTLLLGKYLKTGKYGNELIRLYKHCHWKSFSVGVSKLCGKRKNVYYQQVVDYLTVILWSRSYITKE